MSADPETPPPPAEGGKTSTSAPAPATVRGDEYDPIARSEEAVHVELPEFEGPLDLLLHLIKKHELDIVNIPIVLITEKYLEYIQIMTALNLDIAGEYLLMAATLAYLKSRELVPQADEPEAAAEGDEEEVGDPRQALIKRLLEYQKYKDAALHLGQRPVMGRNVWPRGAPADTVAGIDPASGAALEEVPVFRLIEALEKVLARARIQLTHDVVVERISITDKINELIDRLGREPTFTFASCFQFLDAPLGLADLRHQIVITFMALLEMTRLKLLRLHQAADRGEIYVARPGAESAAKAASPVEVPAHTDENTGHE